MDPLNKKKERPGFMSYIFQGLDLSWLSANTSSDILYMGILFEESEAKNMSQAELILTGAVQITPGSESTSFPLDSIQKHVNWIHVMAFGYHMPQRVDSTGDHAADELVLVILSMDICLYSGES